MQNRQPDPNDIYARFTNNWAKPTYAPAPEPVNYAVTFQVKDSKYLTGQKIYDLGEEGLTLFEIAHKYKIDVTSLRKRLEQHLKKIRGYV